MEWDETWDARRKRARMGDIMAYTTAMAGRFPSMGATYVPIAGGYAFYNGRTQMTFAVGIGEAGPVTLKELKALEFFYRQRGTRTTILISKRFTDQSFVRLLEARRYTKGPALRTMWRSLPGGNLPPIAADLNVNSISSAESETWARVVAAGFRNGATPEIDSWEEGIYLALGFAEKCKAFLTRRLGQPAGGGVLVIRDEIAFLRTTSTLPTHRHKGVQTSLIVERLSFASEAGCRFAFSAAKKGDVSERNLARVGFDLFDEGCQMSK